MILADVTIRAPIKSQQRPQPQHQSPIQFEESETQVKKLNNSTKLPLQGRGGKAAAAAAANTIRSSSLAPRRPGDSPRAGAADLIRPPLGPS